MQSATASFERVYTNKKKKENDKKVETFAIKARRCHKWYTHKLPSDHVQLEVESILDFLPLVKPDDSLCLVS